MTNEQANAEIMKGPIVIANGGTSPLCAYRVCAEGLYFSERVVKKSALAEDQFTFENSEQVNFVSHYTILNSFGKTYNVGHIDELLRKNAASAVFA
jgi:hypothetical protein